jgi:hypothetical protein
MSKLFRESPLHSSARQFFETRNPPEEWLFNCRLLNEESYRGIVIPPGITALDENLPEEWLFRQELPSSGC